MSAADCPRRFTLLTSGGVLVRWDCGAERVDRSEEAVDVVVLAANIPTDHHHLLHLPRKRR